MKPTYMAASTRRYPHRPRHPTLPVRERGNLPPQGGNARPSSSCPTPYNRARTSRPATSSTTSPSARTPPPSCRGCEPRDRPGIDGGLSEGSAEVRFSGPGRYRWFDC